MAKSPDAFRTISEVADWLDVQAHVLRFWESKFTQVKPIKRAGGRRYYRPNDMLLLGGIKKLLHDDGLTIKGVQKILREEGMGHVSELSAPLDDQMDDAIEGKAAPAPAVAEEKEKGVVLDFSPAAEEAQPDDTPVDIEAASEEIAAEDASDLPEFVQQPLETKTETSESDNMPAAEPVEAVLSEGDEAPAEDSPADDTVEEAPEPLAAQSMELEQEQVPDTAEQEAKPDDATRKPRIIDLPDLTPVDQIAAAPSALTAAFQSPGLTADQAADIAPLLTRLTALRDRMHSASKSG